MQKPIQFHINTTNKLIVATFLFLLTIGIVAVSQFLPLQAAPSAQGQDATPTPNSMMSHGMMGSNVMSSTMSMAEMSAMMDQMLTHMNSMVVTMPMSGTMPMHGNVSSADVGMMMQMMGVMQQHTGHMQMMMGATMSSGMVGDTCGMDMHDDVSFDAMFIDSMIEHHQGAIEMAEIALKQAEHEELRILAEAVVAAQTAEIEQMQEWLTDWYDITD